MTSGYKQIRLKPDVRAKLNKFAAQKQMESGEKISDNDAVEYLLSYYSISESHAGCDDSEATPNE